MRENISQLSFCLWFILLHMMTSIFTHFSENDIIIVIDSKVRGYKIKVNDEMYSLCH